MEALACMGRSGNDNPNGGRAPARDWKIVIPLKRQNDRAHRPKRPTGGRKWGARPNLSRLEIKFRHSPPAPHAPTSRQGSDQQNFPCGPLRPPSRRYRPNVQSEKYNAFLAKKNGDWRPNLVFCFEEEAPVFSITGAPIDGHNSRTQLLPVLEEPSLLPDEEKLTKKSAPCWYPTWS